MISLLRISILSLIFVSLYTPSYSQPALQWEQTIDAEIPASSRVSISYLTNHNDSCLLAYNYTDPQTGSWKPNLLVYSKGVAYVNNYTGLLAAYRGYSIAAVTLRSADVIEDFYVMLTGEKENRVSNLLLHFKNGKMAEGFDFKMGTVNFKTTSMRFDSLAGDVLIVSKDAQAATCYVAAFNEKTRLTRVGTFTNASRAEVFAVDRDSYIIAVDIVRGNTGVYFDGMPVKGAARTILKSDKQLANFRSYQWHMAKYSRLNSWNVDELRMTAPVFLHYNYVSLLDLVFPDGPTHMQKVMYMDSGPDDWLSHTGLSYFDDRGAADYSPAHEEATRYSIQFTTRGPVLNFTPLNTTPSRFLAVIQPTAHWGDAPGSLELGLFAANKINLGIRRLPAYLSAASGYAPLTTFNGDTTYLLCHTNHSLLQGKPGIMLSKWYIPDSCKAQYPESLLAAAKAKTSYLYTDKFDYKSDGYTFYNKYNSATIIAVDPSDPNYSQRKKLIGKTISAGHIQNLSYETSSERKTSYWVSGKVTIKGTEYALTKVLLGWL
ncbi:MAG: hypothetical protein JST86_20095 [Bacteroidetes bacterium]|nr:hypothetical protein [Bacteroidota bacterium]